MKHYAENLGSNVAAMIKVRQVVYPSIVKLLYASPKAKRGEGELTNVQVESSTHTGDVYDSFCSFQNNLPISTLSWMGC